MAHGDIANPWLLEEGIDRLVLAVTGHAEDETHPFAKERLDQSLATC
jgi:hypothetical protein